MLFSFKFEVKSRKSREISPYNSGKQQANPDKDLHIWNKTGVQTLFSRSRDCRNGLGSELIEIKLTYGLECRFCSKFGIFKLNSGIFELEFLNWSDWNLNLNSSDCKASKIIWNDTKVEQISGEPKGTIFLGTKRDNPLFNFIGVYWYWNSVWFNFNYDIVTSFVLQRSYFEDTLWIKLRISEFKMTLQQDPCSR